MVIIWDIAGQQQKGSRGKAGAQSSLPLQDQPRHILYGHQDAVICLAVCTQLDLVVSAAADGNLLIHTLSSGRYTILPGPLSWHSQQHLETIRPWYCTRFQGFCDAATGSTVSDGSVPGPGQTLNQSKKKYAGLSAQVASAAFSRLVTFLWVFDGMMLAMTCMSVAGGLPRQTLQFSCPFQWQAFTCWPSPEA